MCVLRNVTMPRVQTVNLLCSTFLRRVYYLQPLIKPESHSRDMDMSTLEMSAVFYLGISHLIRSIYMKNLLLRLKVIYPTTYVANNFHSQLIQIGRAGLVGLLAPSHVGMAWCQDQRFVKRPTRCTTENAAKEMLLLNRKDVIGT